MELKHLKSFALIAESGSFSIAATRCHVTQSAISQHIKALEDELNCRLLIRSSHDITLTESGNALLAHAKEIIRHIEDSKEHINAINNCLTGELRLGIGSFIAPYIRQTAITFMERYPNVRLNAEFGKAHHLNQMLRHHQIDLAFTMNTAFTDEGIESQHCIPFNICAIMQATHPLAALTEVSYHDLIKHHIIMPDVGERVFNTFQKYIKHDLSRLNVKCIVSNPDEALAVVEQTNGITFSNPATRETVWVIELTSSAEQFFNTVVHEIRHLQQHIANEYHLDPNSESVCYLCGDIALKLYPHVRTLLCDCHKHKRE